VKADDRGFGYTPEEHLARCRKLAPRVLAALMEARHGL
jgi:hypothetical protein